MKDVKGLSAKEMQQVQGGATHSGKYYGNGVYCGKTKCTVDWANAGTCIAGMSIGGFLGGAIPGKC
ncbi:class II bacteriocin [Enterococcus sp. AZ072]|uniref:class II bacteriocin n=1 Tax=unclassified Enterococcus TaxID=2608891 RepID=UPI003D28D614